MSLRVPEAAVKVDKEVEATTEPPSQQPPVGRPRRMMGISVKTEPTVPPVVAEPEPQEVPPLTLEQLTAYWNEMLKAMQPELPKLAAQLEGRELRLEDDDMFVVVVNNSYLDAEIKPHLIRMLTYLRRLSHRPQLNCHVEVVYEEHEAVAYSARDKYDVMVQANPMLDNFRVLFSEVDL